MFGRAPELLGQAFGRTRQKSVDGNDFLVFNQQFNTLIKAGIPILKALDLLAERAAAERLRPVLGEVRRLVREGTTLSEALEQQGVFPKVYTVSVLAGEKSGNLSGVLEYYIAYQRVTTGLREKTDRDADLSHYSYLRRDVHRDVPGELGDPEVCGTLHRPEH